MSPFTLDLDEPRSISDVIGTAVRCYAAYPALFAAATACVVIPYALIIWIVSGEGLISQSSGHGGVVGLRLLITLLIVSPLVSALHVNAVTEIGAGTTPRVGTMLRRGLRVLPVVAATSVAAAIGIGIGFVLIIIPGIVLAARWAIAVQVAALEDVSWYDCLGRSWRRTDRRMLHVLGVLIVSGLISSLVGLALAGLLGSATGALAIVAGAVVQIILLSFSALVSAVLYYDVNARQTLAG